jgi:hypothetical protein
MLTAIDGRPLPEQFSETAMHLGSTLGQHQFSTGANRPVNDSSLLMPSNISFAAADLEKFVQNQRLQSTHCINNTHDFQNRS